METISSRLDKNASYFHIERSLFACVYVTVTFLMEKRNWASRSIERDQRQLKKERIPIKETRVVFVLKQPKPNWSNFGINYFKIV